MIITKSDVLKALESERLSPGRWVNYEDPSCPVCAVGAVLRGQGLDDEAVEDSAAFVCQMKYCPSDGSIPLALTEGNYLGALSMQFERFCEMAPIGSRIPFMGESGTVDYEDVDPRYVELVVKPAIIEWAKDCLPEGVLYRD